jgi:uncharacterized membrane protein
MKKIFSVTVLMILSTALYAQNNEPDHINYFPNYHPLIVHFPIVLLLIAAAMQIALMFFKNTVFNYTIITLTVIGFITGWLAASVFHAHAASNVSTQAMELFEEHEKLAFITIWLSGIASLFKIIGLFTTKKWIEVISLLLLLGSSVAVSLAGHHGSELVYKQGIGPKGEKLEQEHKH